MKTYTNNTTEDFLNDNDFRSWVNSGFNNNVTLSSMMDDASSNKELLDAIEIMTALNKSEVKYSDERKNKLFDRISDSIDIVDKTAETKAPKKIPAVIKYLLPIAIAASYFIIFFYNKSTPEKLIVVEQAKEIIEKLPDGSTVTIDGGSNLKVAENFRKNRTLNLEGRAFFEVKKGKTFKVVTDNGTIEVLGTSFTVLSRDNIFEVVCKTGKVKVTSVTDTQPQVLTPNEKVVFENNTLVKTEASQSLFEWQKGNYYFTETKLSQVVKEIENQFNVKVNIDSTYLTLKYTGFFSSGDLDKALYSVTWPLNLKFNRLSDREIEIKK